MAQKIVIKPTLDPVKLGGKKKKRASWLRVYYRPFFFVALPLGLLSVIFALIFWEFLPPMIPLFYTLTQVDEQLVNRNWIFILPAISVTILMIHFGVIYFARRYDQTLLKFFSYMTIFVQALLLAVLLRVILIII